MEALGVGRDGPIAGRAAMVLGPAAGGDAPSVEERPERCDSGCGFVS